MSSSHLVLLVQPVNPARDHAVLLTDAGFRVHTLSHDRISAPEVLDIGPDLIAVELEAARSVDTLDRARRLRADTRTRSIPVILYAAQLQPDHIQNAAQVGVLCSRSARRTA